jgi:hypothetical protein
LPVVPEPLDKQLSCRVGLIDIGQQFENISERPRFDEIDADGAAEGADATAWRSRRDDVLPETAIAKAFGTATLGHRHSQAK